MTFRITLSPSGHSFDAKPDQSILQAGLAAGNSLPYSCRTGVCVTCKSRVLSGEIEQGGIILEKNLTAAARAEGYALICTARALSDCTIEVHELEGLAAVQPKLYPARITKLEKLAPDVAVIQLRMPMNENMHYLAGQYVELVMKDGTRRSYSIANAPNPENLPFLELHVRHVPNGIVSSHLNTAAKERDLVKLEGPFGTFFLRESEKPVVLVASGTGFAPIKAIVEQTLRKEPTRELSFYWGGRTRVDLYAAALAESWAPRVRFIPVLSAPSSACNWTGRTGPVHEAVMADLPDLSNYQVYACGSPRMVDAARADFTTRCHLPADEFFADAFITTAEKQT